MSKETGLEKECSNFPESQVNETKIQKESKIKYWGVIFTGSDPYEGLSPSSSALSIENALTLMAPLIRVQSVAS